MERERWKERETRAEKVRESTNAVRIPVKTVENGEQFIKERECKKGEVMMEKAIAGMLFVAWGCVQRSVRITN